MTWDSYLEENESRLRIIEFAAEKLRQRLGLARRIRENVQDIENPLKFHNRSFEEMKRIGDPACQRLVSSFPFYVARPLIEKMQLRTMTIEGYNMVVGDEDAAIIRYAAQFFMQQIRDDALPRTTRYFAERGYINLIGQYPDLFKSERTSYKPLFRDVADAVR